MFLHDSTGTVDVRRDGISILSISGVDTKNGGTETVISTIGWTQAGVNTQHLIDDIYISNNQGSLNNGFLGEIVVETLYPNGSGTHSGLVGSDGDSINNFQNVDETSPNDSDYNGSATVGAKDTYNLSNLVRIDGTIVALAANLRTVKSDAGAISMRRTLITPNGAAVPTLNEGADIALATPASWTGEIIEQNPVLVAPWTIASINGLELGAEVRA